MMKKTILHIATAVMLLAIFTACEKEALQAAFEGNNGKSIRILLNAQGDDVTRAVSRSDGNDAYGENTIATADVFFYNAGGTLIYNVAKENVTLSEPDANGVVTATVPMPSSDENIDLTQATKVYVMGNRQATDGQVADTDKSEAALRALTFTTNLATDPTAETTFAMDGTGDIDVTDNEISGTVELVRNAAKITLTVNLPSTLTADDKTYKPQTKGITVTFNKGVKTFGDETDMFNVGQRVGIDGTADAEGNTPVSFEPFYSYPTTWKTGDDNEPYFTLHVPWGETNSEGSVTSYTTYHYRVPINKTNFDKDENGKDLTTLSLNRNHWYQINLTVGVLGTPEASDYVEVPGNYEVKPWGNLPIGADLLDFKYLVVDQREISIYNVSDAQITFASSNDVTVRIDSIAYYNYAEATTRRINIDNQGRKRVRTGDTYSNFTNTNNKDKNLYTHYLLADDDTDTKTQTVAIAKDAGIVNFTHTILTDTYVPHDIYITIKHTDDTTGEYEEKVKITQYPPIYIVGQRSLAGSVFVNKQKATASGSGQYGLNEVEDDDNHDIGSVQGYNTVDGSGTNNNQNQYTVYVTISPNTATMIGDPRRSEGSALSGIDELTNYQQTKVDANTIISPAYKIASSYGKTTTVTYENAVRRCASYQENGYPAGRWRIPTKTEIEFVVNRSTGGDIPTLFDGGYWASNGQYYSTTNGWQGTDGSITSNDKHYVRCVYDVWYWGNENTGSYYNANGTLVINNPNFQLTNAVWGDTGSVIVK